MEELLQLGRNPLGSGLGVSSVWEVPAELWPTNGDVAIPSVRVSVFRPKSSGGTTDPWRGLGSSRNPLGSGLGVSSCTIKSLGSL